MGLRDLYRKWFKSYPVPEPKVPKPLGLTKTEDRLVYKVAAEWRSRMTPFAKEFVDYVNKMSIKNGVSPKYIWYVLFSRKKKWPPMQKNYKRSLIWAISLGHAEGAMPSDRGWEYELPDDEDIVDVLIDDFGLWSYVTLLVKKVRGELLSSLGRYVSRFKPVFLQKWHTGGSYTDKDVEAALLLELVQQTHEKHWRFTDFSLLQGALQILGFFGMTPPSY